MSVKFCLPFLSAPSTAVQATISAVRERMGITGLDYGKIKKM